MKKNKLPVAMPVLLFALVFFQAAVATAQNPLPILGEIKPDSKVQHLPSFTLTASGSDFVPGTVIFFNGVQMPTNFVTATVVNCVIQPNDILVPPGFPTWVVPVHVYTPPPGGGVSAVVNFTIHQEHAFKNAVEISGTTGDSEYPQVVVDNRDIIHAAWTEELTGGYKVYYRRSSDDGATWDPIVDLSPPAWSSSKLTSVNAPANLNGDVYVFLERCEVAGFYRMYYRHSGDNGVTWGNAVSVSGIIPSPPPSYWKTDANGNFLALRNRLNGAADDVYFRRSVNQGVNWPIINNVSNNAGNSDKAVLDVAANGGILAAWRDATLGADDIFYARSGNNGINFSAPVNIGNSLFNDDIEVETASPGEVYVCWTKLDFTIPLFPNIDTMIARSGNNGANFTAGANVFGFSSSFIDKSVCVDTAGNINHVATDYNWVCWFAGFSRSLDQGTTWSPVLTVSPTSMNPGELDMAVNAAGNIYIVWDDSENRTGPNAQVYFCRGESWKDR